MISRTSSLHHYYTVCLPSAAQASTVVTERHNRWCRHQRALDRVSSRTRRAPSDHFRGRLGARRHWCWYSTNTKHVETPHPLGRWGKAESGRSCSSGSLHAQMYVDCRKNSIFADRITFIDHDGEVVGWKQWGDSMKRDHGSPYYNIHVGFAFSFRPFVIN